MHPAVEEPGIATHKPLQALAEAMEASDEAGWYCAFHTGSGQPVTVHVAVGQEALVLARFIELRRRAAPQAEKPLVYDGEGRLADGGNP